MKNSLLFLCAIFIYSFAFADEASRAARQAFEQQQMLAEVPRLVSQFDQLAKNQEAIVSRLERLEGATGDARTQNEIAAIRAELAELKTALRRDQEAMRREIVSDLSQRLARLTPAPPPPAPVAPPRTNSSTPAPATPAIGPHYVYAVEAGQTLSLIAKGFDTTVAKIVAANPTVKAHALRVGQKLIIPIEENAPSTRTNSKGKKGKR